MLRAGDARDATRWCRHALVTSRNLLPYAAASICMLMGFTGPHSCLCHAATRRRTHTPLPSVCLCSLTPSADPKQWTSPMWYTPALQNSFSFASYWRDPTRLAQYRALSVR